MNVFAKNTTSSSITVAGHKVYYIDSTDAEIVEVERTSGQALPSVGDTVTFGNYPQATSTPAPIKWTVLAVDSVNGKALLLSKYILDAHVYNAEKVSVSWATCTLRDWLNDTFYNAAFNSEEQSGIVTTHNAGSGLSSDDKVFCLTQDEATSYIPVETDRRAVATRKAIDDGASAGSGYGSWWNLDWDVDSYYRVDMISSGGNLSSAQIIITWMGVRPAIWVSFSGVTTTKYNAFKYTISGTPYWYVIDGEHDTWTDDLSAWGYSEVQPVETLPTVTTEGDFASYNWLRVSSAESVSGGGNTSNLTTDGTDYPSYNTGNSYAILQWQQSGGTTSGRVEFSIVNANGKIQAHNSTSGALTFYQARVAVCSSNQATVIIVYNSSNNAYNAFKFTASGTDYYYVLDGTQTDWTDDLAGIGYHTEILVYFTIQGSSETNNTYLESGRTYALYDAVGNLIPWIDSIPDDGSYTITKFYNSQGQDASYGTLIVLKSNGYIYGRCNGTKTVFSGVLVIP